VDAKGKAIVDPEGDKMRAKSLTGKFPVLETPQGHTLMEGLTIAKYLAR
jgi:glutathione S-transferase